MTTFRYPGFWVSLLLNLVLIALCLWKYPDSTEPQIVPYVDPQNIYQQYPIDFENATAVFNTVNGALKQKDCNMNPVGVSFIPAYLPPNTLMYHGTHSTELPGLYEWVAMDFEFSYGFAGFSRGKKRPDRHGPPHHGPPLKDTEHWGKSEVQSVFSPHGPPMRDSGKPFLYTLRNTRALDKLIYLDGASAAKTSSGEMDQQMILSKQKDLDAYVDEHEAAAKICKWGRSFGLQGVVRLEIGYEIILCDFFDHIELVSNVTLHNTTELGNLPFEPPVAHELLEKKRMGLMDKWKSTAGFEWVQAGARTNGGDKRILLDFAGMVTPLNRTYVARDPYKRRLNHIPDSEKNHIILKLETYLQSPGGPYGKTDWQLAAQNIAEKLGPLLVNLNSTFLVFEKLVELNNATVNLTRLGLVLEEATTNITSTLYNFMRRFLDDNYALDKTQFVHLAVTDYVHHTHAISTDLEVLIYSSLYRMTTEILSFLWDTFSVARDAVPDFYVEPTEVHYEDIKKQFLAKGNELSALLKTLAWPLFTRCSSVCGWDEVCYVPTWGPSPMGWGQDKNSPFLEFDGERYRIPMELSCVSVQNMLE